MNEDIYRNLQLTEYLNSKMMSLAEEQQFDLDREYELEKRVDDHILDSTDDETINAFVERSAEWRNLVDATPKFDFDLISKEDRDHMAYQAWMLIKSMESTIEKSVEGSL